MSQEDWIVFWDEENPRGNVAHIALNGLTPSEVEDVLLNSSLVIETSRSSGRPCRFGYTSTGKYIIVIWVYLSFDPTIVEPLTAYEVPEPF